MWLALSSSDRNMPNSFFSILLISMPTVPECPVVHVRRFLVDLLNRGQSQLLSDIDGDNGLFVKDRVRLFCVAQPELGFRFIWASRPRAGPDGPGMDAPTGMHLATPHAGAPTQAEAVRERALQGVFCRRRAPRAPAGKPVH